MGRLKASYNWLTKTKLGLDKNVFNLYNKV